MIMQRTEMKGLRKRRSTVALQFFIDFLGKSTIRYPVSDQLSWSQQGSAHPDVGSSRKMRMLQGSP